MVFYRYCNVLALLGLLCFTSGCSTHAVVLAEDVPRNTKSFSHQPENFQFVIVGDRTGGHRPGVFRHAIERVNQLQPEFVVGVGDLIEGYKTDEAALKQEWDEFDDIVNQLDMPFFYTVGNHDIGNDVMHDVWQQRYGRTYYHFVYRDVLFISLNTEDPPITLSGETIAKQARLEQMMLEDPKKVRRMLRERRRQMGSTEEQPKLPGEVAISEAQKMWVASVLEENADVRWTILLMHKPAWSYDGETFRHIEQLLSERPYTMIAGHKHYYNFTRRLDRDYVTMAATGGVLLSEGAGGIDHVAWVTMTDEGPQIANIALCGMLGTPQQLGEIVASNNTEGYCLRPEED